MKKRNFFARGDLLRLEELDKKLEKGLGKGLISMSSFNNF